MSASFAARPCLMQWLEVSGTGRLAAWPGSKGLALTHWLLGLCPELVGYILGVLGLVLMVGAGS